MVAFNLIPFPGLDGALVWAEVGRRLRGPKGDPRARQALDEMNRALKPKPKKRDNGSDNVRPIR